MAQETECSMSTSRAEFRKFLTDPKTGALLDAALADNKAVDDAIEALRVRRAQELFDERAVKYLRTWHEHPHLD
jgi:hypothetical protein